MKIGFTIGKFAPLHKGHEYLIDTALKDMDKFYIVVYDTDFMNIDMKTKINWIKNKYQNVEILKAYNSPKQYGLDKNSIEIQMKYLKEIIKEINVTHFYSSEPYGKYVAEYLNINNVVVDMNREKYNICAEKIRNNIELYKDYMNSNVYNDLMKKSWPNKPTI